MRAEASKPAKMDIEGRSSPIVNSSPPAQAASAGPDGPSNLLGANGVSNPLSPTNRGRTNSFSYSSVLTSSPSTQLPPGDVGQSGNGVASNHDKPFKYTKEEMLYVWKANSAKFKTSGLPLEFEKHDAVTSADVLEPALLTEMTAVEKEV